MAHPSRHIVSLSIVLGAAGCSAIGTPLAMVTLAPRDHHDPAYLNDAALAAWAKGERGTARILLERAAVIAPGDARVRHNLEVVNQTDGRAGLWRVDRLPARGNGMRDPALTLPATPSAPAALQPVVASPLVTEAAEIGIWPPK